MSRRTILLVLAFAFSPVISLMLDVLPTSAGGTVVDCSNDTEFSIKLSGGGTVGFSCGTATITLTSVKTITQNTTIDGGNLITLSGGGVLRLFSVSPGATLTLMNITVRDGNSSSGDGGAIAVATGGALTVVGSHFYSNTTSANWSGSAIYSLGPLNITNSEFAYNTGGGGAVKPRSANAVTTISGSRFHHNQSTASAGGGYGGAMQLHDAPNVTISGSDFYSNTAGAVGGAIFVNVNSAVTLTDSTLTYNRAITPTGGGLDIRGHAFISHTQILSNTAPVGGGGINSEAGTQVTVVNSTIAGNIAFVYANDPNVYKAYGGGIRSLGALTVNGSTIRDNVANVAYTGGIGGGIYHETGALSLTNVTIQGNRTIHGAGIYMASGTAAMTDVRFVGNFANLASGYGGGLRVASGSASLTNATFTGNSALASGGGIDNYGSLTVVNSTFNSNHSGYSGGGIANGGTLTLTDSIVSANRTESGGLGSGGGISNGGTLTLNGVTVDGNYANYNGGGISNGGTLYLNGSTVSNNTSNGGDGVDTAYGGGGIYNGNSVSFNNSTVNGNKTNKLDGGGMYNGYSALATALNTTFSGNTAPGWGGGILSNHAQTTLVHVTLSGNSAAAGGGIYNLTVFPTRTVLLENTILANSPTGYNCAQFAGSLDVQSYGYNLSDDNSFNTFCLGAFQANDLSNADDNLGPLANYGGPTLTHFPLPGSAAIDKIPQGTNFCGLMYPTDQRGLARPQGAKCDIGAVEYLLRISQTIGFGPLPGKRVSDPPFTVSATASSGLPVTFTAVGPCSVSGNTVTLTTTGTCTLTAHQPGSVYYEPAADMSQSFSISAAMSSKNYLPLIMR